MRRSSGEERLVRRASRERRVLIEVFEGIVRGIAKGRGVNVSLGGLVAFMARLRLFRGSEQCAGSTHCCCRTLS